MYAIIHVLIFIKMYKVINKLQISVRVKEMFQN